MVTKLLRPVMGFVRSIWQIMVSVYMDDMILQSQTAQECFFSFSNFDFGATMLWLGNKLGKK